MNTRQRITLGTLLLGLLIAALMSSPGLRVLAAPAAGVQGDQPELVLFLAASSPTPFADLSGHHTVNQVMSTMGESVQVVWEPALARNVFSFADGGWLEVLDDAGLLTLTSADELTIEIGVNVLDPAPENCLQVAPDPNEHAIFSKGPVQSYPRNYALVMGWSRWMGGPYCPTGGYGPYLAWGQGRSTSGVDSPGNPAQLGSWHVYAFRIAEFDQYYLKLTTYKNAVMLGDTNLPIASDPTVPYPQSLLDSQVNNQPLAIGNGYGTLPPTMGEKPFFGKIDYIRIYRGLLPEDQLNSNPYGPIPDLPPPPAPTVTVSDAVCSVDDRGRPAAQIAVSAADGSGNPLPAEITAVQIANHGGKPVRGRGVFDVAGADVFVHPNGTGWTAAVTATATDAHGTTTTETVLKALPRCR